jgi:hypothetical protein
MTEETHLVEMLTRYVGGDCTPEEVRQLSARLERDSAARDLLAEILTQGVAVREVAQAYSGPVQKPDRIPQPWLGWFAWRPLTAAAAGLALGLFSASVVFGFSATSLRNVMTLLRESFESGPAPLVIGVPIEAGAWSGDYSEVVGELQGVRPGTGMKMLRFVRGDFEGRSIPSSHSSDVFRLIDIRPFRSEFSDGGAVVQLTALFNAVSFPEDETFSATLTIFALEASLVGNEKVRGENVLSTESLAYSRSTKVVMDRNPGTWQKVINELRLPSDTDYLMIRMGMSNDTESKSKRRDSFAGHFADKVQLVIARRAEIPVP